MLPRTRSPIALVLSASLLLTQSGCYDWVAIQPTEISKLRTGSQKEVGTSGNGVVVAYTAQTLTAVDGTSTQIKGDYDLRLTTEKTQSTYEHPVVVEQTSPTDFTVQGGNQPRRRVNLNDIKTVEVSQYNKNLTGGLVVGIITGASLLAAILILGSSSSNTPPSNSR